MIKCILMDVDGTLMDTKDIFYHSLKETLNNYKLNKDIDSSLFGMSVDQVLNILGIDSVLGIKEYWEKAFAEECQHSTFYSGIEAMMRALTEKGIIFFIVTSRSHCTVNSICNESELSPYISGCIAAEDTQLHKPNPEPIIKALEITKSKPEETLYVGDTYQDYKAASAAGIRFGFAGWNKNAVNENYTIVFRFPEDIIDMIGEI